MAPPKERDEQKSWQIDRRIPLTLVFMVVVQTAAFIWSAAKLSSDVNNLRETTVRLESQITRLTEKFEAKQENFATKEEIKDIKLYCEKLDNKISNLEQKAHSHKK